MNEGGIPALVHDILESHFGEWFTVDRMVTEILQRRPEANPDTIRRAVERMKADGRIDFQLRRNRRTTITVIRVPWRAYWEREDIA